MPNKKIYILMVLAALFWSGAFITGKITIHQFPAFALTFFRFLFALPFIFFILFMKEKENFFPKKNQIIPIVFLGFIGTFLYHVLFFSSLKYTTATNSSLIGATNPMITALLAIIFFGERITPLRIIGIFLSFSGVILVATRGDLNILHTLSFNPGDILMFVAICFWAIYSLLSRLAMQKYQISPLVLTAYTFLTCTIITLPFFIWENPYSYLKQTNLTGWGGIFYMSIFASVLGYYIHLNAVKQIGAAKAAIFVNLVPVFTIIQSILFLGEQIKLITFFSAGIIILGVYLTTKPESAKTINQTFVKEE